MCSRPLLRGEGKVEAVGPQVADQEGGLRGAGLGEAELLEQSEGLLVPRVNIRRYPGYTLAEEVVYARAECFGR